MSLLQSLVVALLVATAFGYAAWALAPGTLRRRLARGLSRKLGGPGASGLRGSIASRLERIAGRIAGGCSDCAANIMTPAERRSQRR